ncbi:hypothetical protein ESCO_001688 [Escovopsis weberi]|uniref:Uncharacterized protein n=1 Tax=Escovopsis weberi TaxID=150374 RepID=A0A0M8N8I3_ESCWE|nr:hypothetical protein ESCO_001688 [Escovopsis weberi]
MRLNLHYMGADKSPFVPQTPAQLTAFKAEIAEMQQKQLKRKVSLLQERSKLKENPKGQPAKSKLQNCFNDMDATDEMLRVDWPSLAELKEDGDKRAAKYGRYLPLPRMNMVELRILEKEREKAYKSDGSIF